MRHQAYELKQYQSLSLDAKIRMSEQRIRQWYEHYDGHVYVSFSGGKDSTVLLHLVRSLYPDVPAVFSDTGLEYPEIRRFAMAQENVLVVRPKMRFPEVIRTYGYPIISKEVAEAIHFARRIGGGRTKSRKMDELMGNRLIESERRYSGNAYTHIPCKEPTDNSSRAVAIPPQGDTSVFVGRSRFNKDKWLPVARDLPIPVSHYCCNVMKKLPMKSFQHRNKLFPFIGSLAEESTLRKQAWIRHGCNAYESTNPSSQPLSFWTEQDILEYISVYHLPYCEVYGDIVPENEQMELDEHPKLKCTGCNRTGCVFCGFGAHVNKVPRFLNLRETHHQLYRYCIGGGMWADNPAYVPDAPEYDGEWKNWNPKQIWVPSLKGLGMGRVFDMLNDIYGEEFIKYK